MKKILLGTTAVVALATMSTEAFAADKIALSVGGFMRHYVGVMNHDELTNTVANSASAKAVKLLQFSNTEIHFKGSTTLDNGIKVSVVSELEADGTNTAGRNADQNFLALSSDAMGKLEIGTTPHAGDKMLVGAPSATVWGPSDLSGAGSLRNQVASGATSATNNAEFAWSASTSVSDMGNSDAKINYYTPSFSGVTGFVSYTAAENFEGGTSSRTGSTRSATRDASRDGATMGVAYSGEVSGVSVEADLSHLVMNGMYNQTHVGLNLGMAGFTIGGGFADQNDDSGVQSATVAINEGTSWDLGVAYETGPYSVSASYYKAKSDGTTAAGNNEDRAWIIGAGYDLGAGVGLSAAYWNGKADPEGAGTTVATGKSTTNSGMVAGIEVGF